MQVEATRKMAATEQIVGRAARLEDEYTLIINRGSDRRPEPPLDVALCPNVTGTGIRALVDMTRVAILT